MESYKYDAEMLLLCSVLCYTYTAGRSDEDARPTRGNGWLHIYVDDGLLLLPKWRADRLFGCKERDKRRDVLSCTRKAIAYRSHGNRARPSTGLNRILGYGMQWEWDVSS